MSRMRAGRHGGAWVARVLVTLAATVALTIPGILPLAGSGAAQAGEAKPVAEDPATEARVWALANELRCLVCQNQTIADSHADLAVDLKNQIREQIRAGRSDRQIVDFMVERYGDFVLYRPPLRATTALLWAGPALLALLALGFFVRHARAAARETAPPGDAQALRRADELLGLATPESRR